MASHFNELHILKFLSIKEIYETYNYLIDNKIISREVDNLRSELENYYNDVDDINPVEWIKEFKPWFYLKYPKLTPTLYDRLFENLDALDPTDVPEDLILKLINRDHARELMSIAGTIEEGTGDFDEVFECLDIRQTDLEKYNLATSGLEEDDFEGALVELTDPTGFVWPLEPLQQALGSLRLGDFVLLGGRPGVAKTTFLAFLAGYWASSLEEHEKILIFNNEERNTKFRFRLVQSVLSKTSKDIRKDPKKAAEDFYTAVGGKNKIHIIDCSEWNTKQIEKILKETNPKLIFFDQISKLRGHDKRTGNEADRLAKIAAQARRWANAYAPIISTIWADATAEGQLFVGQNQLYGSKTGVVGESDAIINVGKSEEEDIIGFNIPRNKLLGEIETMRHTQFEAIFIPSTARFYVP